MVSLSSSALWSASMVNVVRSPNEPDSPSSLPLPFMPPPGVKLPQGFTSSSSETQAVNATAIQTIPIILNTFFIPLPFLHVLS